MKPHEKIIFALDTNNWSKAMDMVETLHPHVGMFKVGLELFISAGPIVIHEIGAPVMLDLKLHDIPETVERAVKRAVAMGVRFCTLHVQQKETLKRAVEATRGTKTQLLGVTVLTSMMKEDLQDLTQDHSPDVLVLARAEFAFQCGVLGLVCSPQEVAPLRNIYRSSILVVPGIRPDGAALGDQKRAGTPKQAILDGASYLVVGRPIRDAPDPVQAAKDIAGEIQAAQDVVDSRRVTTGDPHE